MEQRNRKKRVGVVVSDKMQKTRVVRVEQVKAHSFYNKVVRSAQKYKVHDEKNASKTGDRVEIIESRPLSKEKKWVLGRILESQI